MRRLLAGLLTIAALAVAAPAQAYDEPVAVNVPYDHAAGEVVSIQIEAGRTGSVWGLRKTAREFDALLDGVTIRATGTCAENPTAHCVRVFVADYSEEQQVAMAGQLFGGLCVYGDVREVHLNAHWSADRSTRKAIAAHEFGHVLGLGHHAGPGVTGDGGTTTLSPEELAVLQAAYDLSVTEPTPARNVRRVS